MKEGWEYKKLGDLCQVLDSQRKPVTKKDRTKGIYPYYGATGIQDYVDSYIFDGRFLLVGEDGAKWGATDKTAYIIEGKSWVNNHAHILKVLENLNDRLLEYYLTFKDLSEYITGAVVPKLTQKALVSIPIPVPPLSEQQHIVEELDLLSSIIEKKKAQLNELDNLAQSLFYEMFGDPITNEKGWEMKKMDEVCNVTSSKRIFANEYCGHGVPFYRGKEITEKSKGQEISVELYISTERYEEIKKEYGIPIKGDILITAVGTIGNIWVVNDDEPFYFKDGNIIWLKDIKSIDSVYFKTILSLLIAAYKQQMVQGCAYNALTIVNLKKMFFALPPQKSQQQFASKIESIEHQKELIKQSIKEVETLFNSRMDFYFN